MSLAGYSGEQIQRASLILIRKPGGLGDGRGFEQLGIDGEQGGIYFIVTQFNDDSCWFRVGVS
jgi:hypothetical protein